MTGTWALVRLALRRDRIKLTVSVLLLGLIPAGTISAYEKLYPTGVERAALAAASKANPSLSLIYGPPFAVDTPGGYIAYRYGGVIALVLGLVCAFAVVRHTRAEEDTGRLELLGSAVLGRYAPLAASVAVGVGTALGTGLLLALGLIANGRDTAGSFALGATVASGGIVFTGVATVTAQLGGYARSANGLAGAVAGVAFLLRAVGDTTPDVHWLSWLSPLGWAQQVRSFAGERWWVLALPVAVAVLTVAAGCALRAGRDLGAGIVAQRPGPAVGSGLRGAFSLAGRLHRGSLLAWVLAMAVLGAVLGGIADGFGDLIGGSAQTRQIILRYGGSSGLVDVFLAVVNSLFGLLVAGYGLTAALRLRGEETAGRAEPLLATGLGRGRLLAAHLVLALAGSALVLAAGGAAAGLAHGLRTGDVGTALPGELGGMLAQLPAVWVSVGVAVLLFGLLPRQTGLAWGVFGLFLVLGLFGPAVNLDQALLDVSPFTHVPKLPGGTFTATPLLWLTGVAALLLAAGALSWRRRDVG